MAYIGRPLQGANLAVMSAVGNGSSTTPIATLNYATTTNGIAVYLDGVRQLAGTDYNVTAQTTLTFTTAPANGVGVDVYFLGLEVSIPTPADGTISTAKLEDNAVTLAKMAGGTDGQIITYDASGDPVAVGPGTDGQVLTSTGAGSPPAFENAAAGGAWTLIATAVASNSSSLTITGLSSTYETYAVMLTELIGASDNVTAVIQLGDSGGIDESGYYFVCSQHTNNATTRVVDDNSGSEGGHIICNTGGGSNVGNAAGEGFMGIAYVTGTTSSAMFPTVAGTGTYVDTNGRPAYWNVAATRNSNITVDRILFKYVGGNITSGRMSVYGIAHA